MQDACVTFDDLTLGYASHAAVHHLSGSVKPASLTALVGTNGSGKSTLMKGIAGLLKPLAGAIKIAKGTRIAYLPQQSELDRSFPVQVADLVGLGLWPKRGLLGRHSQADREAIKAAIHAVGLEGFEKRTIDTLSGGQLQRALFARVILQDANLILLDEPFNAVDARTIADLMRLMKHWQKEGRTILVVVHDLDLVRLEFPDALLLARQKIAWGSARQTLSDANLKRAYAFQEAWDDNAPWCGTDAEHDHAPHDHKGHDHSGHDHHGHDHEDQALAPIELGTARPGKNPAYIHPSSVQ